MSVDDILKVAAALTGEPVEVAVVVVGEQVAARLRTASGTILHEGTGATTEEATSALRTVVQEAASKEAASLDAKAAALRDALR